MVCCWRLDVAPLTGAKDYIEAGYTTLLGLEMSRPSLKAAKILQPAFLRGGEKFSYSRRCGNVTIQRKFN